MAVRLDRHFILSLFQHLLITISPQHGNIQYKQGCWQGETVHSYVNSVHEEKKEPCQLFETGIYLSIWPESAFSNNNFKDPNSIYRLHYIRIPHTKSINSNRLCTRLLNTSSYACHLTLLWHWQSVVHQHRSRHLPANVIACKYISHDMSPF